MPRVIDNTYTTTQSLTISATDNPATVTSNGTIDVNSASAFAVGLYGSAGFAWTITNLGTVESIGSLGIGVQLQSGGVITNGTSGSTALIRGSQTGIQIGGSAGTIDNFATVISTGTASGSGILLQAGGQVTNEAGGSITAVRQAILGRGGATTVINAGLIQNSGPSATVYVRDGGVVTNTGTGMISGQRNAVNFDNTSGTAISLGSVVNSGTIQSTGATAGNAVYFGQGGVLTNQAFGLITAAHNAVHIEAGVATLVNFGTITKTGADTSGQAVYLGGGGQVTNYGLISGSRDGTVNSYGAVVNLQNQPGTVDNRGTIATTNNSNGVNLHFGGTLVNGTAGATAATITASHTGVYIGGAMGTPNSGATGLVFNYGTIESTTTNGPAVSFASGGTAANRGLVESARIGISFQNTAGTIDNFGSIYSTAPLAASRGAGVYLGAGGLITNEAGASIIALRDAVSLAGFGTTSAGATVINSGILAGNVGIGIGAADTGDNTIINFGTIASNGTGGLAIRLGAGNDRIVIELGSVLQGAVGNFNAGDTFDLAVMAFDTAGSANLLAGNVLQIVENSGTTNINLDPNENFAGDFFHLADDGSGGTLVTEDNTPCFCRGTLILTDRGEVPVEDLAIAEGVMAASGEVKPIKWIGRRSYDGRFIAGNRAILPIRVAADALAEGLPARDLWLSPEHALYIDGALVPARYLVNGLNVTQPEAVEQVDYFHIELQDHDILFADGMPAESFVDCDNRGMFHNGDEFARLYPDDARAAWQFCAPRLEEDSAELTAIRARLLARAEELGYQTTGDPGVHLIVDGAMLSPAQGVEDGVYSFAIPADSRAIWLASRSVVPAELEAGSQDRRRLGVPVKRIVLRDADLRTEIGCGHAGLREGFHENESGHRWTDGMGRLPEDLLHPFACNGVTVEVHLIEAGQRYPASSVSRRFLPLVAVTQAG